MGNRSFSRPEQFSPVELTSLTETDRLHSVGLLVVGALISLIIGVYMFIAPLPWWLPVAWLVLSTFPAIGWWWSNSSSRKRLVRGLSLTLSPEGLEYTGDSSVRRIAWEDLRSAAVIPLIVEKDARVRPPTGFAYRHTPSVGVVGRGTLEVTGGPIARATYEAWNTAVGTDHTTGEQLIAIPLDQFAPRWDTHRIGEWISHHRPDITARATEILRVRA